ncbi:MAG: gamma-D-glutamyl-L-lysine dipeptidyl-peptidase [Actinomycetota bacterium]|nr:gamma-D-glutamyl-L-lysine dipeptidyl-peptidase [Actinomycetota bacterium]
MELRRAAVLGRPALLLAAVLVASGQPALAPSEAAAVEPPVRHIAVSVATLWVQPGIARPVDKPSLTNPAHPGAWVADMTVTQKKWLFGRLETQAHYGAKVYVLATSGTWSKVAVAGQRTPRNTLGYPGWLPTVQLTSNVPASTGTTAVVRSRTAWVWRGPTGIGTADGKVMRVSYDTRFPVVRSTSTYVVVRMLGGSERAVKRSDVLLHTTGSGWDATRARLRVEAHKMLGLQYLWAGVSGFGYDCSGFTYSVYDMLGIRLRRDASAQARHGTPVARSDLRVGDLVFFTNSSGAVVHVAMYDGWHNGVRSVIESPGSGSPVRITPLSHWPLSRYAGARRYLS